MAASTALRQPDTEIAIGVQSTDQGDWLICGLCNDVKYLPLNADQAAWERASRWIALHRVSEHSDPLMRQGRN